MTEPKSTKKHAATRAKSATDTSAVHVTPSTSQEVSAPALTLVTSAAALAPAVAAASPITPPGDLPPAVGAPAPRAGWEPSPKKKGSPKGLRPKGVQATNAPAVAKELTQSTTYVADFGTRAPAAAQVAFVVTNAAKWRDTWEGARRFFVYAAEQRAVWENEALAQMDALKPAFEYAASRESAVAEKYAATSKYLGATNAIAERAATVRKAKAKAETKEAAGATAASSGVAPPAPAAATPEAPGVVGK
jgi:hypothetical protein